MTAHNPDEDKENLVIILLDGFRFDFQEKLSSPNIFERFENEGVRAEYVQSIFPSVSFPSWTSIATGLYPEEHNIVGNAFVDPKTGLVFDMGQLGEEKDQTGNPLFWKSHIPLWSSAEHEGLKTSVYKWSRCDVPFVVEGETILPTKCMPVDNYECTLLSDLQKNLNDTIADLQNGIRLAMVYNSGSDSIGHKYGPDSSEMVGELESIEKLLNQFVMDLHEKNLLNRTNIIIVSDHGMTDMSRRRAEAVTSHVNMTLIDKVLLGGSLAWLKVKPGVNVDAVKAELQNWESVDVYKPDEIPEHYHLKNTEFGLDLLLVAKQDVKITEDYNNFKEKYIPELGETKKFYPGYHGWNDMGEDPAYDAYKEGNDPDMRTIFYGLGPAFKRGYSQPWIKMVDEYQIFKHILGIKGKDHRGTFARVAGMFADAD